LYSNEKIGEKTVQAMIKRSVGIGNMQEAGDAERSTSQRGVGGC